MGSVYTNTEQVRLSFGGIAALSFSGEAVPAPNLEVVPSIVNVAYNRIRIKEICLLSDLNAAANDLVLHFFDRNTGNLVATMYENTGWQGFVMMPAPTMLPWNIGGAPVYGYYVRDLEIDIPAWRHPVDQTRLEIGLVLYNGNAVQAGTMECLLKYEKAGM